MGNSDLNEFEVEKPTYKSLGQIRDEGVSIGALATAIESRGIYSWDRYNRFSKFPPEHAVSTKALDALALVFERQLEQQSQDEVDDPLGSPWLVSGWPLDDLPDFAAIAARQLSRDDASAATPPDSALLLIGALLRLVVRDTAEPAKVTFSSSAQLMATLVDDYAGVRGLSERTLQSLFSKAKETLTGRERERQHALERRRERARP